ncbi:MAG: hypothetical protein LBG47_09325 [Prevotellaceae bacterium]|jgi:hypothetical protein|nr:hypothetical protein [Prevotellaceae bacterium]
MLQTQILRDRQGVPIGVFIPQEVWESMKCRYPDIESLDAGSLDADLPKWEKDFIDRRLEMAMRHPECLKPVETLFEGL